MSCEFLSAMVTGGVTDPQTTVTVNAHVALGNTPLDAVAVTVVVPLENSYGDVIGVLPIL